MTIIVCPLSRAPELARAHKVARAVSLLDPGTQFPDLDDVHAERHLRLALNDVEAKVAAAPPVSHHVGALIDFVSDWDRQAPILIHCWAGISRSTASAFITACLHNPAASETDIAWSLRRASRRASPNRRLIAMADAALERNGRMIAAIEAIGRGEGDWFADGESEPFMFDSEHERAK